MPSLPNPFSIALQSFSDGWQIGASLGDNATLKDTITIVRQFADQTADALEGILEVQGYEWAAVNSSLETAAQIGSDLEQIEGDWQANFTRLTDVILPNALAAVKGEIGGLHLNTIRQQITGLTDDVRSLGGEVATLNVWKRDTVTPDLSSLKNFVSEFVHHYQPAIKQLIEWLAKPGTFANWATPILLGPLVNRLAEESEDRTLDKLSLLLVTAWADQPNDTWGAIEKWLLTG